MLGAKCVPPGVPQRRVVDGQVIVLQSCSLIILVATCALAAVDGAELCGSAVGHDESEEDVKDCVPVSVVLSLQNVSLRHCRAD